MSALRKSALTDRIRTLSSESKMDILRKTAQITSEHFGIEVIFRGSQAYTDSRTIVVPSLPEDAPDDLVEAIIGYIDHEVGHILDTDFTVLAHHDVEIKADPRKKLMVNAVEDIRQEYINGKRYRGVGLNLEFTEEWTLRRIDDKWERKDPDPAEMPLFNRFCILAMARAKMVGGHEYSAKFYEKWAPQFDLEEIIDELDDEIATWETLPSTEDAWQASLRTLDALEKIKEMKLAEIEKVKGEGGPGAPDPDADEDDEGSSPSSDFETEKEDSDLDKESSSGSGSGDKGGSSDDDEEDDSPSESDLDDEDEDDAEETDLDDAEGEDEDGDESDDEDESESSSVGGDDDEEYDGEEDDDADGGGGDDDEEEKEKEESSSASIPSNIAGLTDKDIPLGDDGLHEFTQMEIASGGGEAKGHRPYSTEFDRVVDPRGDGSLEKYGKALEEARSSVNVVYTILTRTLLASARAKTQYGRQEGRINTNAVGMLSAGSPNVFKRKRKGLKLNTYVEVIVDQSGSMSGYFSTHGKSKIALAQQTCIVLSEALDRIGVPFGICGFTCGYDDVGIDPTQKKRYEEFHSEVYSKGNDFHRLEPLIEYRYKRAEDSLSRARPLLSLMCDQRMMNNADGDSIMKVAKRVMRRKEKRKILIVLSDGYPAAQQGSNIHSETGDAAGDYMRRVAKIIKRTPNLEVIGIGIESDSVSKYYDRYCVVKTIADLPKVAVNELKEALVPGVRQR